MLLAQFILQLYIWKRKLHLKELLGYWTFFFDFCVFHPVSLLHTCSFVTPSFTLHFIKESLCFARLKLFHSFFNLLSLIEPLLSLALSAKCTLCGRRSVCMHIYTHTHIQKRSWIGPELSHTLAQICLIGCIHTRCPAAPEITSGWCFKECCILHRRIVFSWHSPDSQYVRLGLVAIYYIIFSKPKLRIQQF